MSKIHRNLKRKYNELNEQPSFEEASLKTEITSQLNRAPSHLKKEKRVNKTSDKY